MGSDSWPLPVYHTSRPGVPDFAYIGAMTEAYRELVTTFGRDWERGAVDEITSVFAPDAVFLETPFSNQRVGIDQIRDYWKDVPTNQADATFKAGEMRSEEHTSELQSP